MATEKQSRKTLEALADVDAGRVVDHDDVQKWAAGLGRSKSKKREDAPPAQGS